MRWDRLGLPHSVGGAPDGRFLPIGRTLVQMALEFGIEHSASELDVSGIVSSTCPAATGDGPRVTSPAALSQRYIEAHNRHDLDGLLALVADDVDFKRAGDPPLRGKAAVRRQYEDDWGGHMNVVVNIAQVFEGGGKVAVGIHVHSGPPSDVHYDGVVVHHWNAEDRLTRYRLFVDEVAPADNCS